VSGQVHAPVALPPGERAPGTHWIGGWVNPRANLDDVEKKKILTLPGLELRLLGRPARSIPTTLSRLLKVRPIRNLFNTTPLRRMSSQFHAPAA
jgi:hypothetical protein